MTQALVGRQPIFRANGTVYGYEFLFRSPGQTTAVIEDGDRATADVLVQSLVDIGLDTLVGRKLAFVNLTRNLLLGRQLACIPSNRVVLEILEDVSPDAEVLDAIRELSQAGYTIALDDFVYQPEMQPLVELADIIKLEFPAIDPSDLPHHIATLRERGVKTILAEKLETKEDVETCKRLGCDLFQGYFYCKPEVVEGRRLPNGSLSAMQLIIELQQPEVTFGRVEQLLETDPNLSFRLLRFANSANVCASHTVESLRQATSLMGLSKLRSLASMMLLSTLGDSKPSELVRTAMIRAKLCEQLARVAGHDRLERFHTLGLFSVLDALLDLPMEEIVQSISLSAELTDALTKGEGILGETLAQVIALESGDPAVNLLIGVGQLQEIYVDVLNAVNSGSR
ncbi:MAG: HDOD domain-containing protein [Planctomycetota bacterium]